MLCQNSRHLCREGVADLCPKFDFLLHIPGRQESSSCWQKELFITVSISLISKTKKASFQHISYTERSVEKTGLKDFTHAEQSMWVMATCKHRVIRVGSKRQRKAYTKIKHLFSCFKYLLLTYSRQNKFFVNTLSWVVVTWLAFSMQTLLVI